MYFFFFKQKTAYEMRISDWSSDVCSSDLNALLEAGLDGVARVPLAQARQAATTREHDFIGHYVEDLGNVLDFDLIRGSGVRLGVDPPGGAGVHSWARIPERHSLDLDVVSGPADPPFSFMTLAWARQSP